MEGTKSRSGGMMYQNAHPTWMKEADDGSVRKVGR